MFLYIVELVKIGHILTLIYCDCGDEEIIFDDDLNQQKVHTFVCRMATRTRNVKFFLPVEIVVKKYLFIASVRIRIGNHQT